MHEMAAERALFAHRRNDDGTFDSICPRCFQTIAQSKREPDLQNAEDRHVCDSLILEHYRELSKAVAPYRKKGT